MLGSDEARAWYGPDHVELAGDRGAIGTLLISDELFRQGILCPCIATINQDFSEPMTLFSESGTWLWSKEYAGREAKCSYFLVCMNRGNVRCSTCNAVFSLTVPIELNQLTGIAAILTFPLDVEVVEAEEREAKQELESNKITGEHGTQE